MNRDRSDSHQAEQAAAFANRLRKNARHRQQWARRQGVSCYRLYDRDIPEVPLCVDWYENDDGPRVHLSHYLELEREREPSWLEAMVAVVPERLGIDAAQVFVKEHRRTSGADQYERVASAGERFTVAEGGHRFYVNLSDYVDSGLFLDHRDTRRMVGELAPGARFLNLFSYTGSFTVYAAAAGASETVSVDLSRTYTAWATDNLTLNGIESSEDGRHQVLAHDVFAYVTEARAAYQLFDLIVVDPPIFSNSKRMAGTFDVERDHVGLLRDVHALCRPRADVFFSTSRRKFRFDDAAVAAIGYDVTEITEKTVPADFGQRRPHRCWRLQALVEGR